MLKTLTVSGQTDITISGKVTDKVTGDPIAGATVLLKKSEVATVSGKYGDYHLEVSKSVQGDTLLVEFLEHYPVHYTLSLDRSQSNVDIALEQKVNIIEEVQIYTGYQKMDRRASTGSVEAINEKDIQYGTQRNLIDRIEGLFSGGYMDRTGYNFNGAAQQPDFRIRGESSLDGETFPLIVVDNFPFEGSLDNINPEDIENITVLKDAAASSIWGVRAGNGVLVITTKKGSLNQPLAINFSSDLMVAAKPNLFADQTADPKSFIEMENFLFEKDFYETQINDPRRPPLTPVIHLLVKHKEGSIDKAELERQLELYSKQDVRKDFLKYIYRTPIENNSHINLRGGGDKTSYSVSFGYNKNAYSMPTNGQDRFTIRLNQSYTPMSRLTVSTDLSVTRMKGTHYNDNNRVGYDQMRVNNKKLYPYARLKDVKGNNAILHTDYDKSFIDENQNIVTKNWSFIPLDELEREGERFESQQVILGFNLDYQIYKGVKVTANSQLNSEITGTSSFFEEESYFVRDLYNSFTYIDDNETSYGIPPGGIRDDGVSRTWSYSIRSQLDVQQNFLNNDLFQGIIGAEIREVNHSNKSDRTYGVHKDRNSFALVDFTSTFPLFSALGGRAYIPHGIAFSKIANRFVSFYSSLNYTLEDRYFLSLSARNDASNIFGIDTKDKWSPLWSVGGGWEVSNERFYNLNFVEYLKVRSSFGYSGNVDASVPAELVVQQASYLDFYTNQPFSSIVSLQNRTLRWEKVQTFNLALDWKMLQEKLGVTVDYYKKISKDLVGHTLVDPTLGVSTVTMNSAKLKGEGVDITMTGHFLKGDWSWEGTMRAGYNRTVLKKYYGQVPTATNQIVQSGYFEGKERNILTSFRWGGLTGLDGAPKGYENGEPSTNYLDILRNTEIEDLVYHGSSVPRLMSSFRSRLRYKNLELGFSLMGQFSYYFRKSSIDYHSFFNNWQGHSDILSRWKSSGDEEYTDVPALYYPLDTNRESFYGLSEVLVRRGDHIRLQDIRLSYFLSFQNKHSGFKSIEFFLMGTDLGLIWTKNAERVDPVYNMGITPPFSLTGGFKVRL